MTLGKQAGLACAFVAAAALAAAAGGPAAHAKPWRYGIIKAKADAGILYMVGEGFAKKEGLDLEISQFQNDITEVRAAIAGELDAYEGGPEGAMTSTAHGGDIKILGCNWPGLPHGIFVHDSIKSIDQLKGKTIAISAPGAMPDTLARAVLHTYHIPASDVHLASLGGDLSRYKALVAGVADAAVVSNEYTPIAAKAHVKELISGQKALPDYLRVCMMSTGKTLATRHQDAVKFMAAEMNALHYALSHKDAALALTRKIAKIKPSDPRPAFIYDWAVKTHAVDPNVGLPLDKLKYMEHLLVEDGKLKKAFPIEKAVDGSIRKEAMALLAKQ